jgi:hypothetical protein
MASVSSGSISDEDDELLELSSPLLKGFFFFRFVGTGILGDPVAVTDPYSPFELRLPETFEAADTLLRSAGDFRPFANDGGDGRVVREAPPRPNPTPRPTPVVS